MSSFGEFERIGVEATGSYGAGFFPFMQGERGDPRSDSARQAGSTKRGKNDDLDVQRRTRRQESDRHAAWPR